MLSFALLGFSAVSGYLAARELHAARQYPDDPYALRAFWVSPPEKFPVPSGALQQRNLLSGCLSVISEQGFTFLDAEVRSVLIMNCAVQARHAQASGISLSEAAAVLAAESSELGNLSAAREYLQESRYLAPTDIGMILHRLRIGFRAFPSDVLAQPGGLLEAELPVLIGSGRGVSSAASLYVQVPELRPIVDRIADDLPAKDRQRFLSALKRHTNG